MSDKPSDHRVGYYDIQLIISNAKMNYVNQTLPMKISKKEVINNDPAHIAMIESVLMYLNGNGLLSTFVKIDYDGK